jgi:hypothetical protein
VNNTVKFFEKHISYFAAHPFEFQRLVGQLKTKQERQLFLHTVYMYYYPDILNELEQLKKRREKQREENELLNIDLESNTLVNTMIKQFRSKQQNTTNEKSIEQQDINTDKITAAYNIISSKKELLSENAYEQFYNLLIQLNSSEIICLETMLLSM